MVNMPCLQFNDIDPVVFNQLCNNTIPAYTALFNFCLELHVSIYIARNMWLYKEIKECIVSRIVCTCIVKVYLCASVLQQREEIILRDAASDKKVQGNTCNFMLPRKTATVGEIY